MPSADFNRLFLYEIIRQWTNKGMGVYGVTFPFLVGAVSVIYSKSINYTFIESVFHALMNSPLDNHYIEVRWCGNIDEPVASLRKITDLKNLSKAYSYYPDECNAVSFVFTTDAAGMFGLNGSSFDDCLNKLISKTLDDIAQGGYSKINGVFGDFSQKEIKFIYEVYELQKQQ